jgi:hypothetical protein
MRWRSAAALRRLEGCGLDASKDVETSGAGLLAAELFLHSAHEYSDNGSRWQAALTHTLQTLHTTQYVADKCYTQLHEN